MTRMPGARSREYLVVYNYGMGGVWGFARANSEAEIVSVFPELRVVSKKPEWMTADIEEKTREVSSFSIQHPSTYPKWLTVLIETR